MTVPFKSAALGLTTTGPRPSQALQQLQHESSCATKQRKQQAWKGEPAFLECLAKLSPSGHFAIWLGKTPKPADLNRVPRTVRPLVVLAACRPSIWKCPTMTVHPLNFRVDAFWVIMLEPLALMSALFLQRCSEHASAVKDKRCLSRVPRHATYAPAASAGIACILLHRTVPSLCHLGSFDLQRVWQRYKRLPDTAVISPVNTAASHAAGRLAVSHTLSCPRVSKQKGYGRGAQTASWEVAVVSVTPFHILLLL